MQAIFLFLTLTIAYHVVHTGLVFGGEVVGGTLLAVIRLVLWLAACISGIAMYRRSLTPPRPLVWGLCILLVLCLRSVGRSLSQGGTWTTILIGAKYDILPLLLLVGGVVVGLQVDRHVHMERRLLQRLVRSMRVILIGGLIWQFAKIAWPQLFDVLGYGPIGDYVLGQRPPLYYRTGPDGMMRYQGIFAGPNNLGYWLVAIGPLLMWIVFGKYKMETPWKVILFCIFLLSVVLTYSRGVILALLVQIFVLVWWLLPKYKKYLLGLAIAGVGAIVALSYLKPGSTAGHIEAWKEGTVAFIQQPMGYGLGSAGPAVHFDGVYLPENHFLQILLDIGWPGLILWLLVIGTLCVPALRQGLRHNDWYSHVMIVMMIGLLGLLVEGMFLHTFEDSMVSYLFLVPLGMMLGVVTWK